VGARLRRTRNWLLGVSTLLVVVASIYAAVAYPGDSVALLIPGIAFAVVGAFLTARVPGNLIGPVMWLGGLAWLFYDLGNRYARYSIENSLTLPGEHFAAWLGSWLGALLPIMTGCLLVVYPDGRFSGRRRWFLAAEVALASSALLGAALLWSFDAAVLADWIGITDLAAYQPVDLAFLGGFFLLPLAAISLVLRFRRAVGIYRQQLKWLALASVLLALSYLLVAVLSGEANEESWTGLVLGSAMTLLPVAIGIAITRHSLYDIDRLISRTVSYAVVIAVLVLVYAGVVSVLQALLPTENPLVVAASTLAAAALFNPVRQRVQGWVDRRFNRSRYDAERVMDSFAFSLRGRVEVGDVVDGWVGVVSETMQPSAIGVWVRE
jgi:hypothetical protein